jgi:RNA recognition motif-containing protein
MKEFSTENLKILFSKYGEILHVFLKSPEENTLANLPSVKKTNIMNYLFAFITFKDFNSAEKAVNEASFIKPLDPNFNKEFFNLSEIVKELGRFDEK